MTPDHQPPSASDPVLAAARVMEENRDLVLIGPRARLLAAEQKVVEADELAATLLDAVGGRLLESRAFGGRWPAIESPVGLLIPGIPVVVGRAENPGPDGIYRRAGDRVLREAVGEEATAVWLGESPDVPGESFSLLWFGPAERYVLHGGEITVEDLFAAVHVPATAVLLERLLVRGGRLSAPLAPGLGEADPVRDRSRVEIRRSLELVPGDEVLDPVRILQLRPEVERVRRTGDEILVRRADGEPLRFALQRESSTGWELALVDGRHPFVGLTLERIGTSVRYVGTVHPEIDPLAPGIRNRLAFDLQADLVAL